MNILITGADGLLGSNVVRTLLSRGYAVTAFVEEGKSPKTLEGLDLQFIFGNILSKTDLIDATVNIDVIIHCAANTSIWPARSEHIWKVNNDGTENLIEACLKNKVGRMIYVGTANSFCRGNKLNPGTEVNGYAANKYGLDYMDSKRAGQEKVLKAVQEQNLPALVVNPTFMIGPHDSKPSSGAMILALINGKIPCYTPGGKNYINVKDVAIGISNAVTMGEIGEAYILGNENLTFKEMFNKIGTVVGAKPPRITLPSTIVKMYGRINSLLARSFGFTPSVSYEMSVLSCEDHYYSSHKAVHQLKLPQTPIENGILDCYEWFKKNGYLKTL